MVYFITIVQRVKREKTWKRDLRKFETNCYMFEMFSISIALYKVSEVIYEFEKKSKFKANLKSKKNERGEEGGFIFKWKAIYLNNIKFVFNLKKKLNFIWFNHNRI